jgi:hypothetical protein
VRLFICGDTHGNIRWLTDYVYPTAMALSCDKIIVLGDFGYWEHQDAGIMFMNEVAALTRKSAIPLYWLHGNHDNWSMAQQQYGDHRDPEGFIVCRPEVFYIPQGHTWSWQARTFRSFGGAYSVDKDYRLVMEKQRGNPPGTLWFPDEQMNDEQMDELLAADSGPKDYVLSHDKPQGSRPGWNRKDIAACLPNQRRLQRALEAHQPSYWLHGHLHYFYTDQVGDEPTTVIGLDPDNKAAETGWRHKQTWVLLDILDGHDDTLSVGMNVKIDLPRYHSAAKLLS